MRFELVWIVVGMMNVMTINHRKAGIINICEVTIGVALRKQCLWQPS